MITVLYIDPGTGSILFAAALGIVSTLHFMLKKIWMKIKYRIPNAKEAEKANVLSSTDLVIFSEGKQYWSTFSGICAELERKEVPCEYWTMDEQDPILERNYTYVHGIYIGTGNKAYSKLNMMQARICVATTPGLDVYQWKRSPLVGEYVHIFHSIDEGLAYRMFGLDFYDTVLLVGTFQEHYLRLLEQLRGSKPKNMQVVGCPYIDELLDRKQEVDKQEKVTDIKKKNEGQSKYTVLVAPTWGEASMFHKFGEELLDALLSSSYHVIVRPHPQSLVVEQKMIHALQRKYENSDISWDFDKDNFQSLYQADVLISDFSSVIFDFLFVFQKPVLCAAEGVDLSVYDAAWVEEPIWRFQVMERFGLLLKRQDFPRLKERLGALVEESFANHAFKEFMKETWQHQGQSAKEVVNYLTKTER